MRRAVLRTQPTFLSDGKLNAKAENERGHNHQAGMKTRYLTLQIYTPTREPSEYIAVRGHLARFSGVISECAYLLFACWALHHSPKRGSKSHLAQEHLLCAQLKTEAIHIPSAKNQA